MRSKNRIVFTHFILAASFICFSAPFSSIEAAPSCRAVFGEPVPTPLNAKSLRQVQVYLADTLQTLDLMRGTNGLVKDTLWLQTDEHGHRRSQVINPNTSPTNIAIDLMIQTEIYARNRNADLAQRKITQVLQTLKKMERHQETGLFFGWYKTDSNPDATNYNLSSIDNVHLAIALWTIQETFPSIELGREAKALFEKMDFSIFYDESSGLIGGNFSYVNGRWTRDQYNFANLGSEARTLYSAGWALGLFKSYNNDADFLPRAFRSLELEVLQSRQGQLLKLWDGSAFQIFFPKMFVGEESFSSTLTKMYRANGNFMLSEGRRRKLVAPAAHSAGVAVTGKNRSAYYHDKAGIKAIVSTANNDVLDPTLSKEWESTFAPYALFMAATVNPKKYLPLIEKLQNLRSGTDTLYVPGIGWMDGLQVAGELAGEVIPAQLAINQGMIALSLLQMQSADGLSSSGRALLINA